MKPTEQNTNLEKELITHIRESLVEYEETYVEGAWEKFNTEEKKRRGFVWLPYLRGAAAILLIGVASFVILSRNTEKVQLTNSVQKPNFNEGNKPQVQLPKNAKSKYYSADKHSIVEQVAVHSQKHLPKQLTAQPDVANINLNNGGSTANIVTEIVSNKSLTGNITDAIAVETNDMETTSVTVKEQKLSTLDFLQKESKINEANKTAKGTDGASKFTLGLVVAPSFGNVDKLNMGYGVSVDYKLSDKFSLNSGLAYNQMSASKDRLDRARYSSPTVSSIVANGGGAKTLEYVEEAVSGIDIPLEIKYHVNKNLYANFGFSVYGIISQKRENTYLEEKFVQKQDDAFNFNGALVTQQVTEIETYSSGSKDYSYLGFYNLSFGYKTKIAKGNSFAVEPFMKLPIKEAKNDNLKLVGAGLKLKFDF